MPVFGVVVQLRTVCSLILALITWKYFINASPFIFVRWVNDVGFGCFMSHFFVQGEVLNVIGGIFTLVTWMLQILVTKALVTHEFWRAALVATVPALMVGLLVCPQHVGADAHKLAVITFVSRAFDNTFRFRWNMLFQSSERTYKRNTLIKNYLCIVYCINPFSNWPNLINKFRTHL